MDNREGFVSELVKEVFEFASLNAVKSTKNALSSYLSDRTEEINKAERISEKTFTRYYDKYVLLRENGIGEPNANNLNILAKILSYESFSDYVKTNFSEKNAIKYNHGLRKNLFFIIPLLCISTVILFVLNKDKKITTVNTLVNLDREIKPKSEAINPNLTKPILVKKPKENQYKTEIIKERFKECMYWDGEQFVAVYCDEILSSEFEIKVGDMLLIEKFKKIMEIDTLTQYSVNKVWYAKNANKLEIFTYHGLHPTSNKTLKPLSTYMLKKYIIKP